MPTVNSSCLVMLFPPFPHSLTTQDCLASTLSQRNIKLPAERVEDIFTSQVDHSITLGQPRAGQLFLGRSKRDITSHIRSAQAFPANKAPENFSQFLPDICGVQGQMKKVWLLGATAAPIPKPVTHGASSSPKEHPQEPWQGPSMPCKARARRLVSQPCHLPLL